MRELFWTTADLLADGHTKREIAALADNGLILPVRRGLWASREAPPELVRAARTGGAATATTALTELGIFVPPDERTHVAMPLATGRRHDPDRPGEPLPEDDLMCVHWTRRMPPVRTLPDRVAPTLLVLEHVVRCLRPEYAVAVIDSALHERKLKPSQLPLLIANLPQHLRHVVAAVDGRSDSGIESIARYLLQRAGFALVFHPVLPHIGEVDMLIGGVLIVELDGRRFHIGRAAFESDRRRDRDAARQGHRTLRFTDKQVTEQWPECLESVRAALAAAA